MTYFKLEFRRLLFSKSFMIAIIVCIFIVVLDAIQDYVLFRIGYDHLSVFEKWIGVRYFSYGSIVWNFLFPIIVSIPYATSLRNEMKTRYSLMIVTVIGKRKYFFVKSMIACLSGFIISAITLILDFMILSCYNPAYYPLIDSMTTSILQNDMLSSYFYSTNALDSSGVSNLIKILDHEKKRGALIIIASHDQYFLNKCSDSVIEMENGRVLTDGSGDATN